MFPFKKKNLSDVSRETVLITDTGSQFEKNKMLEKGLQRNSAKCLRNFGIRRGFMKIMKLTENRMWRLFNKNTGHC